MHDKVNNWLDIVERVINVIRPKAYNTIAKLVVYTGIGLIIESQVNFVHALVVALFEEYIGKSEILRSVLEVSSDTGVGVLLVIAGMTYHLAVTLGKDFIDTKKAELPKYPIFEFYFGTLANKNQSGGEVYLDGPNYIFDKLKDIPEYEEFTVEPSKENSISRSLKIMAESSPSFWGQQQRQYEVRVNSRLYSQRAEILEEWLGYEPLKLSLSNGGEILAKGVEVQINIPKGNGISIKERGEHLPEIPKKRYSTEPIYRVVENDYRALMLLQGKVNLTEDDDCYKISWNIETLQAGVVSTANKDLIFKVPSPVEVECTVFCDELTRPVTLTLVLHPAKVSKPLVLDDIMDDDKFETLYAKIIKVFNNN